MAVLTIKPCAIRQGIGRLFFCLIPGVRRPDGPGYIRRYNGVNVRKQQLATANELLLHLRVGILLQPKRLVLPEHSAEKAVVADAGGYIGHAREQAAVYYRRAVLYAHRVAAPVVIGGLGPEGGEEGAFV